jgi:hypothetical protein
MVTELRNMRSTERKREFIQGDSDQVVSRLMQIIKETGGR